MSLRPGDPAPDFSAQATDGRTISLRDYRGKKVLLYFYPRDDTPGCTAQACSLRDGASQLASRGATVIGVSAQSAAAHRNFSEKHQLNFPLLIDTDHRIADAYGALGTGLMRLLRRWTGLYKRITYVIDEHGHIAHIIDRPETTHHAEEVLRLL